VADCAYVDRRGHQCGTAWCLIHAEVVEDKTYCQRHAGVLRAVDSRDPALLPETNDRAASLVVWIADDIDADVVAMLETFASDRSDLHLVVDPVHRIFFGPQRARLWVRSWKLVAHLGIVYRVEVCVEEGRDTEVVVRVNQNDIARLVPPWIEARLAGADLPAEEDRRRRREFHDRLVGAVHLGLQRSHALV
jgi:hypothetical protein